MGYYRGRDADGSWTEGSQRATLRFHPPEPGRYTLEIDVPESGTWQRSGAALSNVGISVYEGAKSGFWLFLAGLGVMVPGLAAYGGYLLSRRRRWKGSDWTDED